MTHASERLRVWWICGLLLCASTINYMDRQTLSNTAVRIKSEFQLNDQYYGRLEWAFGWAFALGATCFGVIADRSNIRWLYPAVLIAWSFMGFATGLVETYTGLFFCRLFLGLFEAGHWPCALKTTQRLLPPEQRTLGNSVLQSGTAIGAIITPLVLRFMLTPAVGSWRPAFMVIGGVGLIWAIAWVVTIRGDELRPDPIRTDEAAHDASWTVFFQAILSRRFLTLLGVVILINISYHFFRVWLNLFLQRGRGYSEQGALNFVFWFYIANDIGCIGAGMLTLALGRIGWSPAFARGVTFSLCAGLAALGGLLPLVPAGWSLVALLTFVSMGLLGLFPCYYAFSQDLSRSHQGKVTGLLGTFAWFTVSPLHEVFGKWFDQTHRYDIGLAIVAVFPLLAAVLLAIGWGRTPTVEPETTTATA